MFEEEAMSAKLTGWEVPGEVSAVETMRQMAVARSKWYSLVGTLLSRPPSENCLEELFSWECRQALAEWASEEVLAQLAQLSAARPSIGVLTESFDELFNVPGPRYLTPYESVFRDSRVLDDGREVSGLTFGPSTDDVIRYYHLAGLEISEEYDELPDHIGLEVEFMRYLCEREAEALADGEEGLAATIRETEKGFLERHLTAWAPELLARAEACSAHPFYGCLLRLLPEFAVHDLNYLKELH